MADINKTKSTSTSASGNSVRERMRMLEPFTGKLKPVGAPGKDTGADSPEKTGDVDGGKKLPCSTGQGASAPGVWTRTRADRPASMTFSPSMLAREMESGQTGSNSPDSNGPNPSTPRPERRPHGKSYAIPLTPLASLPESLASPDELGPPPPNYKPSGPPPGTMPPSLPNTLVKKTVNKTISRLFSPHKKKSARGDDAPDRLSTSPDILQKVASQAGHIPASPETRATSANSLTSTTSAILVSPIDTAISASNSCLAWREHNLHVVDALSRLPGRDGHQMRPWTLMRLYCEYVNQQDVWDARGLDAFIAYAKRRSVSLEEEDLRSDAMPSSPALSGVVGMSGKLNSPEQVTTKQIDPKNLIGLGQKYVLYQRRLLTDPQTGQIRLPASEEAALAQQQAQEKVWPMTQDEIDEINRVYSLLRRNFHEHLVQSGLLNMFSRELGFAFAINIALTRIGNFKLASELDHKNMQPIPMSFLGHAESPERIAWKVAVNLFQQRGAGPIDSSYLPLGLISALSRIDAEMSMLLLEDKSLSTSQLTHYRKKQLAELLFDFGLMPVLVFSRNPFPSNSQDFHLYEEMKERVLQVLPAQLLKYARPLLKWITGVTDISRLPKGHRMALQMRREPAKVQKQVAHRSKTLQIKRSNEEQSPTSGQKENSASRELLAVRNIALWRNAFNKSIELENLPPALQKTINLVIADCTRENRLYQVRLGCLAAVLAYMDDNPGSPGNPDSPRLRTLLHTLASNNVPEMSISSSDSDEEPGGIPLSPGRTKPGREKGSDSPQ